MPADVSRNLEAFAKHLIEIIEKKPERLLNAFKAVQEQYDAAKQIPILGWLYVYTRGRSEELNSVIEDLSSHDDSPLHRLNAIHNFMLSGNWTSSSSNTLLLTILIGYGLFNDTGEAVYEIVPTATYEGYEADYIYAFLIDHIKKLMMEQLPQAIQRLEQEEQVRIEAEKKQEQEEKERVEQQLAFERILKEVAFFDEPASARAFVQNHPEKWSLQLSCKKRPKSEEKQASRADESKWIWHQTWYDSAGKDNVLRFDRGMQKFLDKIPETLCKADLRTFDTALQELVDGIPETAAKTNVLTFDRELQELLTNIPEALSKTDLLMFDRTLGELLVKVPEISVEDNLLTADMTLEGLKIKVSELSAKVKLLTPDTKFKELLEKSAKANSLEPDRVLQELLARIPELSAKTNLLTPDMTLQELRDKIVETFFLEKHINTFNAEINESSELDKSKIHCINLAKETVESMKIVVEPSTEELKKALSSYVLVQEEEQPVLFWYDSLGKKEPVDLKQYPDILDCARKHFDFLEQESEESEQTQNLFRLKTLLRHLRMRRGMNSAAQDRIYETWQKKVGITLFATEDLETIPPMRRLEGIYVLTREKNEQTEQPSWCLLQRKNRAYHPVAISEWTIEQRQEYEAFLENKPQIPLKDLEQAALEQCIQKSEKTRSKRKTCTPVTIPFSESEQSYILIVEGALYLISSRQDDASWILKQQQKNGSYEEVDLSVWNKAEQELFNSIPGNKDAGSVILPIDSQRQLRSCIQKNCKDSDAQYTIGSYILAKTRQNIQGSKAWELIYIDPLQNVVSVSWETCPQVKNLVDQWPEKEEPENLDDLQIDELGKLLAKLPPPPSQELQMEAFREKLAKIIGSQPNEKILVSLAKDEQSARAKVQAKKLNMKQCIALIDLPLEEEREPDSYILTKTNGNWKLYYINTIKEAICINLKTYPAIEKWTDEWNEEADKLDSLSELLAKHIRPVVFKLPEGSLGKIAALYKKREAPPTHSTETRESEKRESRESRKATTTIGDGKLAAREGLFKEIRALNKDDEPTTSMDPVDKPRGVGMRLTLGNP